MNVARSLEEAERQARGEDVTAREVFDLDELGLEVGAALEEDVEEARPRGEAADENEGDENQQG